MFCVSPQNLTTPERLKTNPFYGKSFFEEGQYKVALDRYEQGMRSLNYFIGQLETFCKLHERHSEKITNWSKTSQLEIRQLSEFGTTKKSWIGITESMSLSTKENKDFAEALKTQVVKKLSEYKSQTYGKSSRGPQKKKEFEKEFQRIQKPWVVLLRELENVKDELKTANEKLGIAKQAEKYAADDVGHDENVLQRLRDVLKKRQEKFSKLKQSEDDILQRINKKKDEYQTQMTNILNSMLDIERDRLKQFNKILESLKNVMDTRNYSHFEEISKKIDEAIQVHDIQGDIKKWNSDFGSEAPWCWPNVLLSSSEN